MTIADATVSVRPSNVGILRFAATGAATGIFLYLLCWLGARLGLDALSHTYLSIFTLGDTETLYSLLQGLCGSFGFGAITGALIAAFYNLFGFLRAN